MSSNQNNNTTITSSSNQDLNSLNNNTNSNNHNGSQNVVESIAAAVGNSAESMRLHQTRSGETPLCDEPFHRDSRAQAAFLRKCAVFSGLLGACSACSILSWRRFGKGFVARNLLHQSSSSSSSGGECSFFQRYLVTPLLLPAALGVSFVVFRGTLFEREFRKREREREEWELNNYKQGEVEEMVRIYMARGLDMQRAAKLVEITSSDDQFFVDSMMTDELGFSPVEPPTPLEALKAGVIGACSYLAAAILPLIAAHKFDDSSSSKNINANLSYAPEGVLAATTLVYSLFQARMLLRSYTVQSDVIGSIVSNSGWVLATYGLTKWSCS
jgi:hypothetical protein